MLYIIKPIFIRKFKNSVTLLKQKKIRKIKSKISPIAVWTNAYLLDAACNRRLTNIAFTKYFDYMGQI
jgi:hypothetical protein